MKKKCDISIYKKILISISIIVAFQIIFLSKVNANTYVVETGKNNETTLLTQNVRGKNGTNTALEINSSNNDTAYFEYKYTELESREFYTITADIKVNSINSTSLDYQHGAIIRLSETPASSEIIQDTTEWKEVSLVGLSGVDGTLNIRFLLNNSAGNVLFDNIKIEKTSEDSNFKIYSYTNSNNKKARIVFKLSSVEGNNITQSEITNWLKTLLNVRENLTNLTGMNVDDGNIDIIATNYYSAVAYVIAGRTEVQWMINTVDLNSLHNDLANGADTPFFITHELGHQHTANQVNFDAEYWGTTLGLMADYNLNLKISGLNGIRQNQTIIDYCYDSYNSNFNSGNYSGDGLTYITFQIILKLNSKEENLGWKSLEETFKNLKDTKELTTKGEKFGTFLIEWSKLSGYNIKNMFYEYDNNILDKEFKIGKFDYSISNDNTALTINNYTRTWQELENETIALIIPANIDGYEVTEINSWAFANNKTIKKVTLPNTLLVINDVAFYNCDNLEEVEIPLDSKLATIKAWAFSNNKVKEIFIPKTVTAIEKPALNAYR